MVQKKLSVKEIAEMAGTSVARVSRVINQNGRFSKDKEKRVKEIIEKYDYQPNQLARGLRVNHTQVIGILVPDITNEFFASITKEVQKHLLTQNYMTLICSTNENVMEAKEQLRRCSSVRRWEALSTMKKRLQGFKEALAEYEIEINPKYGIYVNEVSLEEGSRAAQYIMENLGGADGIFFMTDILAVGGLSYLVNHNIKVPDQVKVVGFDDISMSRMIYPKLTTIHQPVQEYGRLEDERIVDMINGKDVEIQRQRIPVNLVVRETT
ncbi:MAG: LacI family DNA-binding transcriptional regulator [Lachnospiraceae bacterium]